MSTVFPNMKDITCGLWRIILDIMTDIFVVLLLQIMQMTIQINSSKQKNLRDAKLTVIHASTLKFITRKHSKSHFMVNTILKTLTFLSHFQFTEKHIQCKYFSRMWILGLEPRYFSVWWNICYWIYI